MAGLDDVHRFRGCHVSYALRCEGGEEGFHVYVGSTSDVEVRMARHGRGTGAKATAARPPTGEILHIREHDTAREAMLAEVALWSLWAGKLGHQRVRGGRWNMPGLMPHVPRDQKAVARNRWDDAEQEEVSMALSLLQLAPATCPEFHEEEKERPSWDGTPCRVSDSGHEPAAHGRPSAA